MPYTDTIPYVTFPAPVVYRQVFSIYSTILHSPLARSDSAFLYFISRVSVPLVIFTCSLRSYSFFPADPDCCVMMRAAAWTACACLGIGTGAAVPETRFGKTLAACAM